MHDGNRRSRSEDRLAEGDGRRPCVTLTRDLRLRDRLDYEQVHCTNSDLLCREQTLWLEQSMFLGPREDMDDICRAFEKVYDQRAALADWGRREGTG